LRADDPELKAAALGELLEAEGRTQDALDLMKKALRLKAQVGIV